ncbi:MAG: amidohydrolase family protein [Armatimonadetes bacterium]|nr:amidohydrolase family protein [Armatimonadota bacterium]
MRIIDFHAHLWFSDRDPELLVGAAKRLGIAKVCVSGLRSYVPSRREVAELNEQVFAAAERWPDVIVPFVYVNPIHGADAIHMLNDGAARGAKGIKLWVAARANQRCVWRVVERAIELDLPVLQHAWHKYNGNLPYESDPLDVAELGRTFPEATIVMAHLGGSWEWGINAIRDVPNVLADTSGTRIELGQIEYAQAQLGSDRILYGSDAPGCDYPLTIGKISAARIPEEAKQAILYDNAARLLKLDV